MTLRNYTNLAPPLALSVKAFSNSTTLTVSSTAGYPAAPFLLAAERGTGNEEVMLCTALSATQFTVSRGYDGTTPKEHEIGTAVEHTVAAIDFREANLHVNDPLPHKMPGEVFWFAGATIPAAYTDAVLECAGQWVSKATYPRLWAHIGDAHLAGAAPQANDFRLPNLQRAFPMGKAASGTGAVVGSTGGSKDAALVTHTHGITDLNHFHDIGVHYHSTPALGHSVSVTGGDHDHAGAAGNVYAVSIGGPQNDGLVAANTAGRSAYITFSNVHSANANVGVGVGNHGASNTGSPSANGTVNKTTGITGTNNPSGTHSVGTDSNLPPWVAGLYLIKT